MEFKQPSTEFSSAIEIERLTSPPGGLQLAYFNELVWFSEELTLQVTKVFH